MAAPSRNIRSVRARKQRRGETAEAYQKRLTVLEGARIRQEKRQAVKRKDRQQRKTLIASTTTPTKEVDLEGDRRTIREQMEDHARAHFEQTQRAYRELDLQQQAFEEAEQALLAKPTPALAPTAAPVAQVAELPLSHMGEEIDFAEWVEKPELVFQNQQDNSLDHAKAEIIDVFATDHTPPILSVIDQPKCAATEVVFGEDPPQVVQPRSYPFRGSCEATKTGPGVASSYTDAREEIGGEGESESAEEADQSNFPPSSISEPSELVLSTAVEMLATYGWLLAMRMVVPEGALVFHLGSEERSLLATVTNDVARAGRAARAIEQNDPALGRLCARVDFAIRSVMTRNDCSALDFLRAMRRGSDGGGDLAIPVLPLIDSPSELRQRYQTLVLGELEKGTLLILRQAENDD